MKKSRHALYGLTGLALGVATCVAISPDLIKTARAESPQQTQGIARLVKKAIQDGQYRAEVSKNPAYRVDEYNLGELPLKEGKGTISVYVVDRPPNMRNSKGVRTGKPGKEDSVRIFLREGNQTYFIQIQNLKSISPKGVDMSGIYSSLNPRNPVVYGIKSKEGNQKIYDKIESLINQHVLGGKKE